MQRTAQVVSLEGNKATLRFKRTKACAHCGGCISFGTDQAEVQLKNTLNAKPGDWVVVELHAKSMLQASLLMYILPLCMLLAGLYIGTRVSDLLGIILGLLGAGIVFLVLRFLEPRFEKATRFQPKMIAFGEPQDESDEEQGGSYNE